MLNSAVSSGAVETNEATDQATQVATDDATDEANDDSDMLMLTNVSSETQNLRA